jgi:hypothetical protein
MQKLILVLIGITLVMAPVSAYSSDLFDNMVPFSYPSLEYAFAIPAWKTWEPLAVASYDSGFRVPTWKNWTPYAVKSYDEGFKVPAWKSWTPNAVTSYDDAFKIPEYTPMSKLLWEDIYGFPLH